MKHKISQSRLFALSTALLATGAVSPSDTAHASSLPRIETLRTTHEIIQSYGLSEIERTQVLAYLYEAGYLNEADLESMGFQKKTDFTSLDGDLLHKADQIVNDLDAFGIQKFHRNFLRVSEMSFYKG